MPLPASSHPAPFCLLLSASSPSGSPGEIRLSLIDLRTEKMPLLEAGLWHPGYPDGWHDTYLVRVMEPAPAFDGAFVMLEDHRGKRQGFLSCPKSWFKNKMLHEGSLVKAQISRTAQNGKGLRLVPFSREAALSIQTEAQPRLISTGPTILQSMADLGDRLLATEDRGGNAQQIPILYDDAGLTSHVPACLRPRLRRLAAQEAEILLRRNELEEAWDSLFNPTVAVGPLIAHFSPTPALTAIDLDHGIHRTCHDFEANLAAFPHILRQIRLRNLSGIILIDPAGVKSRKRPALLPFLERAMTEEGDPLAPYLSGISPSGLLEIIRPRQRASLYDITYSPHGQGLEILRRILADKPPTTSCRGTSEGASGILPSVLHVPSPIMAALEEDEFALKEFSLQYGQKLTLKIAQDLPSLSWTLT